jgi:DNA processing protein
VTLATEPNDIIEVLRPQLATWRRPMLPGLGEDPRPSMALPPRVETTPPEPPTDATVAKVLGQLGPAPVSVDDLVRTSGLPARLVQSILLELALADRIERHEGQLVSRRAP